MLKDILLVVASVFISGTLVSGLQIFGYGIALCGLIYYKLGLETLKTRLGEMNRMWAEYGARRPALRKATIFIIALGFVFLILGGVAPRVGYDWLQPAIGEDGKAVIANKGT